MPLFGPETSWAVPRPSLRWLLPAIVAALALAFATPLTPAASGQEADPAVAGDPAPAASEPAAPVDPDPAPPEPPVVDPLPPPEPPVVDPLPPPEPQPPPDEVTPPAADQREAGMKSGESGSGSSRGAGQGSPAGQAPASEAPVNVPVTPAAQLQGAMLAPLDEASPTTEPLGWDVYDDALFAETLDDEGGTGGIDFGGGTPTAIGGIAALGAIGSAVERDKHDDAEPVSRADPMPVGGIGPGGSGSGQGPSLSLFGGSGGSAAGIALLTRLGMMGSWLLAAPDRLQAFRISTATWRPSAYVPPIEHPG